MAFLPGMQAVMDTEGPMASQAVQLLMLLRGQVVGPCKFQVVPLRSLDLVQSVLVALMNSLGDANKSYFSWHACKKYSLHVRHAVDSSRSATRAGAQLGSKTKKEQPWLEDVAEFAKRFEGLLLTNFGYRVQGDFHGDVCQLSPSRIQFVLEKNAARFMYTPALFTALCRGLAKQLLHRDRLAGGRRHHLRSVFSVSQSTNCVVVAVSLVLHDAGVIFRFQSTVLQIAECTQCLRYSAALGSMDYLRVPIPVEQGSSDADETVRNDKWHGIQQLLDLRFGGDDNVLRTDDHVGPYHSLVHGKLERNSSDLGTTSAFCCKHCGVSSGEASIFTV